jgi:predicted phage terminase large subunit-like protein
MAKDKKQAITDEQMLGAMLRTSFASFLRKAFREIGADHDIQWNYHIDAILHQLDRVRTGDNNRLIVTIPPRHLKSVIMTAWVAWMLGNNPAAKFICASYGYDLAEKHARDCLRIMSAPWYQMAFPRLRLDKKAVLDIHTTSGGYRMSTSVGGVITGIGANYVIIDDPMNATDARSELERNSVKRWFDDDLPFRLESLEHSAFILIMQRLHEDDLAGHLLGKGGWHELRLPAIAPEDQLVEVGPCRFYQRRAGHALHPARQSLAILGQLQTENPLNFAAQQQQDPAPVTGNFVDPAWFGYYDEAPQAGIVVQSWDTASKTNLDSAFSVGITARVFNGKFYILDVHRERMNFGTLRSRVAQLCRRYSVDRLLIEDASSGQQLIQILRSEPQAGVPSPIVCTASEDKAVRFHAQASKVEGGQVILPSNANWLPEFLKEIAGFPNARFKDQADALAQLLRYAVPMFDYDDGVPVGPIYGDSFDLDYDFTWS